MYVRACLKHMLACVSQRKKEGRRKEEKKRRKKERTNERKKFKERNCILYYFGLCLIRYAV